MEQLQLKNRGFKNLRIKDLLQNDGSFLSFKQFSEKFHLETPFTLYFGLINSIPNDWKVKIKRTPRETAENGNHKTKIISTKNVYSAMLKKVFLPPTAESKILRYGVNRANLNKVYELPFQIKNDIKISMFQYKLTHNVLPTKVSLLKTKISDSDLCPQCLAHRHSLDHMFLHCSSTLLFWNLFQNWWSSKTKRKDHIIKQYDFIWNSWQKDALVLLKLHASYCEILHFL